MKYLLVLLVLVVAFWLWRNNRRSEHQANTPPRSQPPSAGSPVAMIACAQCGTHVPQAETIEGPQGRYCCPEHRRQHEAGLR